MNSPRRPCRMQLWIGGVVPFQLRLTIILCAAPERPTNVLATQASLGYVTLRSNRCPGSQEVSCWLRPRAG